MPHNPESDVPLHTSAKSRSHEVTKYTIHAEVLTTGLNSIESTLKSVQYMIAVANLLVGLCGRLVKSSVTSSLSQSVGISLVHSL